VKTELTSCFRSDCRWGQIEFKISGYNPEKNIADQRFKSLSVKETKEVVSIGLPVGKAPHTKAAQHLAPHEWQETLNFFSKSNGNLVPEECWPIKSVTSFKTCCVRVIEAL
jgi:hypothetical protein